MNKFYALATAILQSKRLKGRISQLLPVLCVIMLLLSGLQAMAQITNDDNIISPEAGGGGGIIKGADGVFYVWGKGAFNSGNPNKYKYIPADVLPADRNYYATDQADYLEPLTPANGFAYTGTLRQAISAGQVAGDNRNSKRILLTTTGLWYMNYGVYWNGAGPAGTDVATTNDGIGVGGVATSNDLRQVNLPVGVVAADVTHIDWVSQGDQGNILFVFIIAGGKVYYTASTAGATTSSPIGNGNAAADANGWRVVKLNATTDLTNVFTAKGTNRAMMAYTTDNKVYAWGTFVDWTLPLTVPGGTTTTTKTFATLAPTPVVPFTMIGLHSDGTTYTGFKGLGTDGKIYTLGLNFDEPMVTGTPVTARPVTGTYYRIQNYPQPLWTQILSTTPSPSRRYSGATWTTDKRFDATDVANINYMTVQSDYITLSSGVFAHHTAGKNIIQLTEAATATQGGFASFFGFGGTNGNTAGFGYGELPNTDLIYIQNHIFMAGNSSWAISADGKVCFAAKWPQNSGLHDNGPNFPALYVYDMNMFGTYGLNNSSSRAQGPRNAMWLCGNPTLADGTPFVPYGTSLKVAGAGSIDCSKTQLIPAPVSGTATQTDLVLTVNVTTAGTFTPSVSGSGMTLVDPDYTITTTTTGIQTFHIPVKYDGTALGTLTFTLSPATPVAGCTADLTKGPKNTITPVWTLDCVPTESPALK